MHLDSVSLTWFVKVDRPVWVGCDINRKCLNGDDEVCLNVLVSVQRLVLLAASAGVTPVQVLTPA